MRWPHARIRSLRELAAMATAAELRNDLSARFGALDASLYGGDHAAFDANGLLTAVERLRQQAAERTRPSRELPPLYPDHK